MNEQRRARLIAYGVAVLGTAVCLLARWPLGPVLEYRHPYLTCLPAILISTYYGGLRPGLLAVLLGALGTQYFLMEPLYSFSLAKANVGLLYFLLVGTILGWNEALIRRRRAEEALRRTNARLELALRGSNVGVWYNEMRDGDHRHGPRHYVNVWEQLGYEGPLAGGDNALDVVHPDDRVRVEEAERRYLAGETTEYETEARLRHKDGSYRTILARGVAVRDAGGKPICFAGVTIDITQLKRAEEALRQANARPDLAMRGSNLAIWECDMPDGRIENSHLTLTPASASRPTSRSASSGPSSRRTPRRRASTAAPAWA
jgi:PAS domain S-box-containing protein